jgi:signal transduction histidine kinase
LESGKGEKVPKILVVDDEETVRATLEIVFVREGYAVETAATSSEALKKLSRAIFDLVITDLRLEDLNGVRILTETKRISPGTEVIIVTAYASLDSAIQAVRQGAYDYLVKPFNLDDLVLTARRGLERRKFVLENQALLAHLQEQNRALEQFNLSLEKQVKARTAELRQAQAQLIQSARMATVGKFAEGIAHEINNPLTLILGNAELVLQRSECDQTIRLYMTEVIKSAERIAHIVGTFLDFAKPVRLLHQPTDVNLVVEQVIEWVMPKLAGTQTQLITTLDPRLPQVFGDSNQLRRAFLNIALNGIEAQSPTGGQVSIVTRTERDGVAIVFSDTGVGFPPEHLSQIFEPGFTTQIEGGVVRELGLGLFVARNIVESHRGRIDVESAMGQGTQFTVWLPALAETYSAPSN